MYGPAAGAAGGGGKMCFFLESTLVLIVFLALISEFCMVGYVNLGFI